MPIQVLSESEARAHATFTAVMWALSYPGRLEHLSTSGSDAFRAIGEALIDLETSYYTPSRDLDQVLAWSGARRLGPEAALYQFYPTLDQASLTRLQDAPAGSYESPDQSAILVIGCTFGAGAQLRLEGPGVKGRLQVLVAGIPDTFWSMRQQVINFPLGWDVLLVEGHQVMGLPRTTSVEMC